MADIGDSGLFAIEVDADEYATTAAGDAPTVARTFQSVDDFQKQKAMYRAKIDNGNSYTDLIRVVPALAADPCNDDRTNLSKRDVQLLGYAVGELYHDRKYYRAITLCQRVLHQCHVDDKVQASLHKWIARCHERSPAKDGV